jgi:hypothetical protein
MKIGLNYSLGSLMVVVLFSSIWLGLFANQKKLELKVCDWQNGRDELKKEASLFLAKIHSLKLDTRIRDGKFKTDIINYISMEIALHEFRVREEQHEYDGLPEIWHEAAAIRQINNRIDKIKANASLDDLVNLRNYIGKFYEVNPSRNKDYGDHKLDCDKEFARLIESARKSMEDSSAAVVP